MATTHCDMTSRFGNGCLWMRELQPFRGVMTVPSPKIEAIRRQVESGNTNTADFWSAVAKDGTPLVEPFDARLRSRDVSLARRGRYKKRLSESVIPRPAERRIDCRCIDWVAPTSGI